MTTAEDDFTSGRDVTAYVDIHTAQKRLPEHTHLTADSWWFVTRGVNTSKVFWVQESVSTCVDKEG